MIPIYKTNDIRKVDEYAINKIGIPGLILMENASINIFNEILSFIYLNKNIKRIGFVCGKGNNGGDGFATARHFANAGFTVNIISIGSKNKMSKDCLTNYNILKKLSNSNKNLHISNYKSLRDLNKLNSSQVIVDAILGSGAKGKLREPYKSIVQSLNKKKSIKIAVDIPTGLDPDKGTGETIFNSDLTVTLGDFKKGLFFNKGSVNCREVVKAGIGINNKYFEGIKTNTFLTEPEDVYNFLPIREKNIHKYSAGKVLTIAGSGKYPGAAALTSKAVLKTGAGASVLCFPKSVRNLIQKKLGEVVVSSYSDGMLEFLSEENLNEFSDKIGWADSISIGPGLGRNIKTQNAVLSILKNRKGKKIIIDADAIYALNNKRYKKINLQNSVLTPHQGEFANLIGITVAKLAKDIMKYGNIFVKETGAYLVLKGAPTIIFTPKGEVIINSTGNPGMAKFGTGDVLTGLIAGFAAQKISLERAIVTAVYLHSLSADILSFKQTELTYTATDILNNIPITTKFLINSCA